MFIPQETAYSAIIVAQYISSAVNFHSPHRYNIQPVGQRLTLDTKDTAQNNEGHRVMEPQIEEGN